MARILVVDDSRYFRKSTRSLLEAAGHEVLEAASAHEAMKTTFMEAPDAIVMDILLPNDGGLSLLEELRRRDFDGPLVVVTADRQPMTRHLATTHGATRVLHQPVDGAAVLEALEEATSLV